MARIMYYVDVLPADVVSATARVNAKLRESAPFAKDHHSNLYIQMHASESLLASDSSRGIIDQEWIDDYRVVKSMIARSAALKLMAIAS